MYLDSNDKAIQFGRAEIRQLVMPLPSKREDRDKQAAVVETRRRSLEREEKKLRELEEDIASSERDSAAISDLIDELQRPHEDFPELSDEEFEKRQTDIRWSIGDLLGQYTFVVGGF